MRPKLLVFMRANVNACTNTILPCRICVLYSVASQKRLKPAQQMLPNATSPSTLSTKPQDTQWLS
jgi:hypothetical protein